MDNLAIARHGTSVVFTWGGSPLKVVLSRFHDRSDKTEAELTVTALQEQRTHLITSAKINLQSLTTRKRLAQDLNERFPAPWTSMIEQVCVLGVRSHREGEPFTLLQPAESAVVPFVVNPLVYREHQTLLYAPGGSCKSYLALFLALLACHGAAGAGVSAISMRALYLDYELNQQTVGGRLTAFHRGHPELSSFVPFYRRCEVPLYQEAEIIAEYVATNDIGLVIVDSVALACGGDLTNPDSAIKLQRAIRTIGCASLVLAHVAKNNQEGQDKTAYGTVFFRELARNVWEAQRSDSKNPARVALHQRKNNFGPLHDPIGFELTFSEQAIQITSCDPLTDPALEERLPLKARIRNLLEDGRPREAEAIAEDLDVPLAQIKPVLSRGVKAFTWMMLGSQGMRCHYTVLKPKDEA